LEHFTLFLDESLVAKRYFSVAGIIANKHQRKEIYKQLNNLKENLWQFDNYPLEYSRIHPVTYYPSAYTHNFVLHEMAMHQIAGAQRAYLVPNLLEKYGNQNIIFRNKDTMKKLYTGVANILEKNGISVTGVVFDFENIRNMYGVMPAVDYGYEMAIQILVENFVQYLIKHNGYGDLVLESRSTSASHKADLLVQSKFYYLKARGTMFLPDEIIQRHLGNIVFIPKSTNSPCLQIADLVPNNFARKMAGKKTNGLGRTLLNRRYDGLVGKPERFGIKQIPSKI
jgi:hypothetical protein